jgi:pyruvate/2-oxoglutarate dehydrogenase complex dihydrolipoamide acyltransferase (E2) component
MPVEILMPELGESVHEATVTRWIVKEGEAVKEDDPVVEIMTDKVNTELPSPATGVLSKILVPEGGSVHVFEAMGLIEEGKEGKVGGSDEYRVTSDESSAQSEIQNPKSKIPIQEVSPQTPQPSSPRTSERLWFTPLVRSIAREHGLADSDLQGIPGTGAGGRVTKSDVESYLASRSAGKGSGTGAGSQPASKPQAQAVTGTHELSAFRKMLAEAMARANEVPTVSTCIQIDVTSLVRFRTANKDAYQKKHGVKLTYTPYFIRALTEALLEFPTVNSSLQGTKVHTSAGVHIGVAVALGETGEEGLIVPVIRDCQDKGIVELAKELEAIAAKARSNALKPGDVQGGTFTLTNPGSYGALFGTPMIVAPQGAIAGAYGIQKMPVVVDGDKIAIRDMMYLVLTYDHRLIDGLLAGRLLQSVKKKLEGFDPEAEESSR